MCITRYIYCNCRCSLCLSPSKTMILCIKCGKNASCESCAEKLFEKSAFSSCPLCRKNWIRLVDNDWDGHGINRSFSKTMELITKLLPNDGNYKMISMLGRKQKTAKLMHGNFNQIIPAANSAGAGSKLLVQKNTNQGSLSFADQPCSSNSLTMPHNNDPIVDMMPGTGENFDDSLYMEDEDQEEDDFYLYDSGLYDDEFDFE